MRLSLRLAFALFLLSSQSFAGPFGFPLPSVDGLEGEVVIINTDGYFMVEVKGSVNPAQTPSGRMSLPTGYPDSKFAFTLSVRFERTESPPGHYPLSTLVQVESENPQAVVEWIRAKGLEISEAPPFRLDEIERTFGPNVRYGLEENAARFSQLSPRDTRVFFFLIRNFFQNMSDLFDERAGIAMLSALLGPATARMHLPEQMGTLWAEKAGEVYKIVCGVLADFFSRILASRTVVPDSSTDIYEVNIPAGTQPGPGQLLGSLDLRVEGISFLNLQSNEQNPGQIPTPLAETLAAGLIKYLQELDRLRGDPNPVRGPEIMRAVAAGLNACADAVEKAGKEKL